MNNKLRKQFSIVTLLLFISVDVGADPSLLCYEGGPCKCYDDDSKMICHGQPLEEWWNPLVYGPHTNVKSLAIIATTLLTPITSLRNFPNLAELEIQQSFKEFQCRPVIDDNVFADPQLARSLTSVKFVDIEILCEIPAALRGLENLQNLEFRRTNLRLYGENDFQGLESLQRLTIANSLHGAAFPPKVFSRLTNLIHLSLEGNENLQLQRAIFEGLETMLIDLNLKKCNLVDLSLNELQGLYYLETLDLSENSLLFQTNLFVNHPNLKYLKLNGNRGTRTLDPSLFSGANQLIELSIARSEIQIFDLRFMENTPKLKLVDGSENYAPLFDIIYPSGNSKKLPKAKLHMCKNSIGFIDANLKELLIFGGQLNITDNTIISCDPHQHNWLGGLVHCHKKHGLIYSQNTKCVSGEEHSFAYFLQLQTPLVCKGMQCKPSTIVGLIVGIVLSRIFYI